MFTLHDSSAQQPSLTSLWRYPMCLNLKLFFLERKKINVECSEWHGVVSESSLTVIVVTASVKEDERGGQSHASKSLLHQSATWHRVVNTHCFYTIAFLTSCFVLSVMDGKIEQHVCIKFCVKLGISATETLEMFREAFGEHSLSRTAVFKWNSCFRAGRVSV
jgi:predicted Na+-dependent transporter